MLLTDRNVLEERYQKAKTPLDNLEQTISLVSQQVGTQIANIGFRARGLAEQYFVVLRQHENTRPHSNAATRIYCKG
jgi:hypothetical protein